ncbi:MAG TPA: coproporphyrinogen III oxidase, partial [Kiloniellaceae bacterium]
HATRQHRAPEAWLDLVARQGHGWRQVEVIGAEQRLAEMVMMGLRLSEGIAREAFVAELGSGPETLLPADRLGRLVAEGYLALDAAGLRATQAGRQRLDALLGYLLA